MDNQTELERMQAELEELQTDSREIQSNIDSFELDESDYEDEYIECLDCEGTVTVCGMEFFPSRILSELDPIAYSCGLSDYVDSIDKEEVDEYKELVESLESKESDIVTLEEEIEDLENEIEDDNE